MTVQRQNPVNMKVLVNQLKRLVLRILWQHENTYRAGTDGLYQSHPNFNGNNRIHELLNVLSLDFFGV